MRWWRRWDVGSGGMLQAKRRKKLIEENQCRDKKRAGKWFKRGWRRRERLEGNFLSDAKTVGTIKILQHQNWCKAEWE